MGVVALGLAVGFSRWLMFGAFGVLLPLALLLVLRRPWYFAVLPGVLCLAGNQWEVLFAAVRLGNPLAGWGLVACLLAPGLGMWLLRGMRGGGWVPAMRRWAYLLYPGHFFFVVGGEAGVGVMGALRGLGDLGGLVAGQVPWGWSTYPLAVGWLAYGSALTAGHFFQTPKK
ncbi:hypothetical protein P308_30375 [Pseudomonas piscis]|nr:hypothetical protein P308_30375 [Pseudomonas piscis]